MSKPPPAERPRRTRLPAEQRKQQILSAAAQLIDQRGYGGVGIDDIGEAVGISGPAVYRHVAGKEALVVEVGLSFLDPLVDGSRAIVEKGDAPAETLDKLIQLAITEALRNTAALTVCLRHLWGISDGLLEPIYSQWNAVRSIWLQVLQATHPDLRADNAGVLVRAACGLVIGAQRSAHDLPPTRTIELLHQAVLQIADTEMAPFSVQSPASTGRWVRASRREQILDTAVSLFRARGYGGVSMADIADVIEVTPSATYRHFDSKEQILVVAFQRATSQMQAALNTALNSATSAEDALDRSVCAYARTCCDIRDLVSVALTEWYHLPEDAKKHRRDHASLLQDEWGHCLAVTRPDLTPVEARVLTKATMGLINEAARSSRLSRRPSLPDDLHRIAMSALRAP